MDIKHMIYEGSDPYIFVSYAHKDDEIVLDFIQKLLNRGYRVWYDAGIEPGTDWSEYIADHLHKSSCVLAFMSYNYLNSRNCQKELKFAFKYAKEPLVVYLEDVKLTFGLQLEMDDIQALFRSKYDSTDALVDALCSTTAVGPCLQDSPAAAQPAPEAPLTIAEEMLLKGDALHDAGQYAEAVQSYEKSAILGLADAQLALGECYLYGEGVPENPVDAVYWFQRAANQGLAEAQMALGDCYLNGTGVIREPQAAAIWYELAAKQGLAEAQRALGDCFFKGTGVHQDHASAFRWYQKSAEQGDPDAQLALANCYTSGYGTQQDHKLAAAWYLQSATQGNEKAQYRIGRCYSLGIGIITNQAEAKYWYQKAAAQGNSDAKFALQIFKASEKVDHLKEKCKAAEKGDDIAQFEMGNHYYHGTGVKQDYEEAVYWYEKSAFRGNSDAQLALGVCYEHGNGVEQNKKTAVELYLKAAEQGNAKAQYKLGVCYTCGEGVEANLSDALHWYLLAAKQDHMQAQYKAAEILTKDDPDIQDLDAAEFWYQQSIELGYVKAKQGLKNLQKKMQEKAPIE